jgi:diaminopimelate epimerase
MRFTKMEGLGNDFILTHGLSEEEFEKTLARASFLCDRRKGIGADGVIFILPPEAVFEIYQILFERIL